MTGKPTGRALCSLFFLVASVACSPVESTEPDIPDGDEAPFFVADRDATGPLTLAELQIDIPDNVDALMSDGDRTCFFRSVERRAQEAGDPADIDPDAFPYWGGNVSRDAWRRHSPYMQRVLLAQAIVSWAMLDC